MATTPFDFTPIRQFSAIQEEDTLGSLIADSYIYAVRQAEGDGYVPVDFAVVAAGVVTMMVLQCVLPGLRRGRYAGVSAHLRVDYRPGAQGRL